MPFSAEAPSPTETPPPKVLAEVTNYPALIAAFRARANECKIARSHENTANVAGLTNGYLQKLLAPKPVRRIGMESLGPVLGVLGVKLLLVVDDVAMARLQMLGAKREDMKLVERNNNLVHDGVIQTTRRFMKKIAPCGGKATARKLNAHQRSASARKAAQARWSKPRAIEKSRDASHRKASAA
jgi:hypothetical protein